MSKLRTLKELENLRKSIVKAQGLNKVQVRICMTGCRAYGAQDVKEAFEKEVKKQNLQDKVDIIETGCHGFCARAPVIAINPYGISYGGVATEDVEEVVLETINQGKIVGRLTYKDPKTGRRIAHTSKIPFYGGQKKIVLRNCGEIDPNDINQYIARDGYSALSKALYSMRPEEVIEEVKKSGLRGRGGAGFPTGKKWELTRLAEGKTKYVICNADEGDPGAFMDRGVLEGDPHSVLEGMLIAGYAIGARQGYIYVRAEYPIAVKHVRNAINQAKKLGLLGRNILGTGFDFDIEVKEGAGAFVCGEETALIASIEGKRGWPRPRPPFPAQSGLWERPTNINNVETYANISPIILKGGKWYAKLGTKGSKGTKVFSLAGKVKNTGLVEVPMGVTLREIIFDLGGGLPENRTFKAVQIGGPSGGCLPKECLDLPVDYESLTEAGAIMGSGGMVVVDDTTCMVELARFFLDFVASESCGKCTPCRIGTIRMLEMLTRIVNGEGKSSDLEQLKELGEVIKDASLCGLGQTAPNALLSTANYFGDEYRAHIEAKRCPAFVCPSLYVTPCQDTCPVNIEVHAYVALIAEGMFREALELIKERNPFPAICGRVCHHPCEAKCRRGEIDQPLALRQLKRFAADHELEMRPGPPSPIKRTKRQKIAVVGAGPAGLAAAHYLTRLGYPVTVFEKLPVPGGMMAVGIPDYRLSKAVLESEIEDIRALGVDIKTGVEVGKDVTLDSLKKRGYRAIFIATGAWVDKNMGIPGEKLKGVISATGFLRRINLGEKVKLGKKVVVVGGGDVALDCARAALRLGSEALVVYRRSREEIPAGEVEIKEAELEGAKFEFLAAPDRVLGRKGKVSGLKGTRMKLGGFDRSGRRRPVPIPGSGFTIEADCVIPAIGQTPNTRFLTSGIETNPDGTIKVDPETLAVSKKGIFAGGDVVTGPATVIEAIAAGDRAATAIDKYLGGTGEEVIARERRLQRAITASRISQAEREAIEKARHKMPTLSKEKRVAGFKEIELGFTKEAAMEEAKRCLKCQEKE